MNAYEFHNPGDFTLNNCFLIVRDFFLGALEAMAIGLTIGFITSYLTKKLRFIAQSVVQETFVIFCMALSSYYIALILNCSGIAALLTCSITMTHYAWHNLSP